MSGNYVHWGGGEGAGATPNGKNILNFHFDYLTPSLKDLARLIKIIENNQLRVLCRDILNSCHCAPPREEHFIA